MEIKGGIKTIPWISDRYDLLMGCDSSTGNVHPTPFVNVGNCIDTRKANSKLDMIVDIHKNSVETNKNLDVSASLAVQSSFANLEVSVNAKFANEINSKTKTITMYVKINKEYETVYIKDYQKLWNQEFLGVDPSKYTEKDFVEKFGDTFIGGSVKGAYMIGLMHFEYSDNKNKEIVDASVRVAVNAWATSGSMDANVKKKLEEASNNSRASFQIYIAGMNSNRPLPTTLDELIQKAKDFDMNTPFESAVNIKANLIPYSSLPGYGNFKDKEVKNLNYNFKSERMAQLLNKYYAIYIPLSILDQAYLHPETFRPPDQQYEKMTGRQMIEWLNSNRWNEKRKNLNAIYYKVLVYFKEDKLDENITLEDIPEPNELDIYEGELPVKANNDLSNIPPNNTKFISGEVIIEPDRNNSNRDTPRISFKDQEYGITFSSNPKILLTIEDLDIDNRANTRLALEAININNKQFTIKCMTWYDSIIYYVKLGWLAIGE